jgi:1-acyl-sn-glycerol-3-phosphate acyltransferase
MQFFHFIFLARSWAADRVSLGRHLDGLAQRTQKESEPFALMIFPEGTLVSKDTRPLSKKYADKEGIVASSAVLPLHCQF